MGKSSRIRNANWRFDKKMSQKPDIERSCINKTTYHNRFDAQSAASYASSQSGESIDYYYCDNCAFYHLGHRR